MRRIRLSAVGLIVGCFLGGVANASPQKTLLLGNSYTHFNDLERLVLTVGQTSIPDWGDAETFRLADGGLRLPDHLNRSADTSPSNLWFSRFGAREEGWNFVFAQDQSQIPGFPESETMWQESAETVAPLGDLALAAGAEFWLFMTWGRRDGDPSNPSMYPDFTTMNARLDAGYLRYAEVGTTVGQPVWIAPVGRAFGAIHADILEDGGDPLDATSLFFGLYSSDGSHPSPLGSAVTASVMVQALSGWPAVWAASPSGVDESDLKRAMEAVDEAVVPFADLAYPWAWDQAEWSTPAGVGDSAADLVVAGRARMPTVGVATGLSPMERVILGGEIDGRPAGGRLWLHGEAELMVSELDASAGLAGEVVVVAGSLQVERLKLGGTGWGHLQVRGGEVHLGEVVGAGPPPPRGSSLELLGGTLSPGVGTTGLLQRGGELLAPAGGVQVGDWTIENGRLRVEDAGPSVRAGIVYLSGTLEVQAGPGEGPWVLIEATRLDLEGEVVAPDGYSLSVGLVDGGEQLILRADATTDSGGEGGEGADGGGTIPETEEEPATSEDGGKASEGCASAPVGGGLLWLLLGLSRRRKP